MPIFIDQTGQSVEVKKIPKRIISLVPSQSEFLWDIGLRDELVGITKFCIHPDEMFRSVERVGGTKSLNTDKIRSLKPDLIIGNKEENERSQIESLRNEFPVWMSDIITIEDSLKMMAEIGLITGKENQAAKLISEADEALKQVKNCFRGERVLYFIWKDPYMLAAKNTFIDEILRHLGFTNLAGEHERYPELSLGQIEALNPRYCFLSTEPYPFKENHVKELSALVKGAKVLLVDGEMFSWYGSRLRGLPAYINDLRTEISK